LLEPCFQPFLVILEIGSQLLPRTAHTFKLPAVVGMTGLCTMLSFFLLKWGSCIFFLNHDLPDNSFPCSLGWQACANVFSYWLRWVSLTYFGSRLAWTRILLISVSKVAWATSTWLMSLVDHYWLTEMWKTEDEKGHVGNRFLGLGKALNIILFLHTVFSHII
jgi:hypothetical protein